MPIKRLLSLTFLFALLSPHAYAATPETPIAQLYLEVSALSALYDLDAKPDQLQSLKTLSSDTPNKKAGTENLRPGKPYRSALVALRDAYVKADENEIGDCEERVGTLEDKMDNPPDPIVEITDAARRKTREALKLFTAAQLAEYIAARAEDAPDPAAMLADALDSVHQAKTQKGFEKFRDHTADEIASLVAGPDLAHQKPLHDSIISFLNQARSLSDDDLQAKRPDLAKQASSLLKSPDSLTLLNNWLYFDMAELLSNPELPTALADRTR